MAILVTQTMHHSKLFTLSLLLACSAIQSAAASEFEAWIPSGWKQIASTRGDLNGDSQTDVALVLEQIDPSNHITNEFLGPSILNTNPRRLLILFKAGETYKLKLSNDQAIPSENNQEQPCLDDPFVDRELTIQRRVLSLKLHTFMSCGSWGVYADEYKFRYLKGRFRLIGLEHNGFQRNSGNQSNYSVNFLTGKVKATVGLNVFEDSQPKIVWSNLRGKSLFLLDENAPLCAIRTEAGAVSCR